jgi:hypothetical protein
LKWRVSNDDNADGSPGNVSVRCGVWGCKPLELAEALEKAIVGDRDLPVAVERLDVVGCKLNN